MVMGNGELNYTRPVLMPPGGSSFDITRSHVPLLIAVVVLSAAIAAAFQLGNMFNQYREIFPRLDRIEASQERMEAKLGIPKALRSTRRKALPEASLQLP